MADKKGRIVLTLLAVLLFLLALGISLFLIFYRIPRTESINYYLHGSDSLYQEGKYKQAAVMLEKSVSFAQGRDDWRRIVKRSYNLSNETEDWNTYHYFAERAVKMYQGSDEFWVYYLSSLLWSGQYDRLLKYQDRLSDANYPTIQAEIRLTEESLALNKDLKPYEGVMIKLENERDAEFYEMVGNISGLDDLKVDALILWMGLGEKERAREIAGTLDNREKYLQILGLLFWDLKEVELSLSYLEGQDKLDQKNHNRRWTLNNLLGDGYFLLGDWEKSEYHYLTSREIKEDNNWKPLVNRAIIYEKAGIYKEASNIILEGLLEFSDVKEVVLYFLDNWQETYPVRAERIVNKYLIINPQDVEVRLAQFSSFPGELTPESYRAFLWELFNDNSGNEKVTRYLLWYMCVLGDHESMRIIMARHEKVIGARPQWFTLYEGLILALKSPPSYEEAEIVLREYYGRTNDWYGAMNLAILQEHMGKVEEAEELRKVVNN
ncbi:MAG: hypothetical protein PQJ59_15100 [Spirochaetales bacterium]|nr:hypothetical protein [Spirochaetales bacterium]